MRCGCPECGEYMVQADGALEGYCACPMCSVRCSACLGHGAKGAGGVIPRGDMPDALRARLLLQRALELMHEEQED